METRVINVGSAADVGNRITALAKERGWLPGKYSVWGVMFPAPVGTTSMACAPPLSVPAPPAPPPPPPPPPPKRTWAYGKKPIWAKMGMPNRFGFKPLPLPPAPPPPPPPIRRLELRVGLDGQRLICFEDKQDDAVPRLCADRWRLRSCGQLDASTLRIDLSTPASVKKKKAEVEAVVFVFFAEASTFDTKDFLRLTRHLFLRAGRWSKKRVLITVGRPRGTPMADMHDCVYAGPVPAARMTGHEGHLYENSFRGPMREKKTRKRKSKKGFVRHRYMPKWLPDPEYLSKKRKQRSDAGQPRARVYKQRSDVGHARAKGYQPRSDAGQPRANVYQPRSDADGGHTYPKRSANAKQRSDAGQPRAKEYRKRKRVDGGGI
jgi:hypothetical protein